jgi:hypothetical protein
MRGCQANQSSQPAKHFFVPSRLAMHTVFTYHQFVGLSGPSPSLMPCLLSTLSFPTLHTYTSPLPARRRLPIPLPCHLHLPLPTPEPGEESMPGCPRRGKRPAIDSFVQFSSSFFCCYVCVSFNSLTLLQRKLYFFEGIC